MSEIIISLIIQHLSIKDCIQFCLTNEINTLDLVSILKNILVSDISKEDIEVNDYGVFDYLLQRKETNLFCSLLSKLTIQEIEEHSIFIKIVSNVIETPSLIYDNDIDIVMEEIIEDGLSVSVIDESIELVQYVIEESSSSELIECGLLNFLIEQKNNLV